MKKKVSKLMADGVTTIVVQQHQPLFANDEATFDYYFTQQMAGDVTVEISKNWTLRELVEICETVKILAGELHRQQPNQGN